MRAMTILTVSMLICTTTLGCTREDERAAVQYPQYQQPKGQYGGQPYGQPPPPSIWPTQQWGNYPYGPPPSPPVPFDKVYHGHVDPITPNEPLEVPVGGWITIQHLALKGLNCAQVQTLNVVKDGDWIGDCNLRVDPRKSNLHPGTTVPASIAIMGTPHSIAFSVKVTSETPWEVPGITKIYH